MKPKDATVNLATLHPAMGPVFDILDDVARAFELPEIMITSGQDGSHMKRSKHHQDRLDLPGEAVDASLRDILEEFARRVKARLELMSPRTFDVVLEMTPTACPKCGTSLKATHLHVEHDPKDPTPVSASGEVTG